MKTTSISKLTRILILISALFLVISIFVPIWRIELDAPQYPEGLKLLIFSNGLGGDVEIINGLNHYIGMNTLHSHDFIEFTILPYFIGLFTLFALIVAFTSNRKLLVALLFSFIVFGIIAMIDFWRWEYNYGHNLNPNAAIIVPGMAYQPPLIGFKQLLNFGAYSIPDIGGGLFIASGLIMLIAVFIEQKIMLQNKNSIVIMLTYLIMNAMCSCNSASPEPIQLNKDNCTFCKMTIVNGKYASELKTNKGRTYKFDDLICMIRYIKENSALTGCTLYVSNFVSNNELINLEQATLIQSESILSPMNGNIAAFKTTNESIPYQQKYNANIIEWEELIR